MTMKKKVTNGMEAAMKRCTLCGGRLEDGRCTECGLDNTKNDRRYRLNTHNEQGMVLHEGGCEENLNKVRDEHTALAQRSLNEDPDAKEEKIRTAKKQEKRRQAGTVKKKNRTVRIVLGVFLVVFVVQILGAILSALTQWPDPSGSDWIREDSADNSLVQEPDKLRPQAIDWNEQEDGYYETELRCGLYVVGYEIPAGRYQFSCEEGTAWVSWNQEDGDSDWVSLYSLQTQKDYSEFTDEVTSYEVSEEIEFSDGAVIYVEDCDETVWMKGIASGLMEKREPQDLEEVTLEDGMVVGADIAQGVYDLVVEEQAGGEFRSVGVKLERDQRSLVTVYLNVLQTEFYHLPLEEGTQIHLETYDDREPLTVRLVPSW